MGEWQRLNSAICDAKYQWDCFRLSERRQVKVSPLRVCVWSLSADVSIILRFFQELCQIAKQEDEKVATSSIR